MWLRCILQYNEGVQTILKGENYLEVWELCSNDSKDTKSNIETMMAFGIGESHGELNQAELDVINEGGNQYKDNEELFNNKFDDW